MKPDRAWEGVETIEIPVEDCEAFTGRMWLVLEFKYSATFSAGRWGTYENSTPDEYENEHEITRAWFKIEGLKGVHERVEIDPKNLEINSSIEAEIDAHILEQRDKDDEICEDVDDY